VSVPGCVRGWAMLHERFGTRPLRELLTPAIHYAERGYPVSLLTSQAIAEFAPDTPDAEWHRVFRPAGRAPVLGEVLVQSDLARTLRAIASDGPDVMYRGRAARAIADRMAAEGFITLDDLADHTGEWDAPISTT
jgi:gamma-glutamyltranspeptidase/glutathione hydrolase